MALAHLLQCYTKAIKNPDSEDVIAITIDHGLRTDSAQEAVQVAEWAKSIGTFERNCKQSWLMQSVRLITRNDSNTVGYAPVPCFTHRDFYRRSSPPRKAYSVSELHAQA